ncbi:MAG: BREX-1 system adenine-specific DNA-methyltransferase PglX, partial [Rhodospirillaceae bacterium]|nr:BREX-1 system adenine-specific DNA-methyltransferase PglX [Rhodospirillaceae bacterium]
GRSPSSDPQGEAYRLLLVASCNQWHGPMPFLFEKIDDYTELLMPEDLLSQTSILAELRDVMTEEACQDVEIIGWLYQFYISEKKDEVFAGLKKNKKITAENIPAATQLFTPHWIVRYLVENSLGRLWLLNKPQSKLAKKMDYYIAPEEPETDFLKVSKPEDIRICDPAAGSGHMLTCAFDLLYAIYEEEGYDATDIPALILRHNLTGIEIDDRAGALAAFALTMKAAAKLGRRRFLRMAVKPDICVLQNVAFTDAEIQDVMAVVGKDLFTDDFLETLGQFEQAKNFGSLIVPKLRDPAETLQVVGARDFGTDLLLKEVQERVIAVLRMAEALSPKYHVVVANPPYMGGKSMDVALSEFARVQYPDSRFDLFAMFMERALSVSRKYASVGMVNMQGWMFASSLEGLRSKLLSDASISTMAHIGTRGFDTISGEVVSTTAFTLLSGGRRDLKGTYLRLVDGRSESEKASLAKNAISTGNNRFSFSTAEIEKIPGQPIAYWLSEAMTSAFRMGDPVSETVGLKAGLSTGDNTVFQRQWHEVTSNSSSINSPPSDDEKWFPCHSGGAYRKWYGNHEVVVNWADNGHEVRRFGADKGRIRSAIRNESFYFKPGITWSKISSGRFDARFRPSGFLFDDTGRSGFAASRDVEKACLGMFCSSVANEFLTVLCPSMSFTSTELGMLPFDIQTAHPCLDGVERLIKIAQSDWDAYETSWDFTTLPLLSPDHRSETLEGSYDNLRAHWLSTADEMKELEEENNRIFIDAYGLQDELTSVVPIEEITLTCNPAYRYGVKGTVDDRETRLRADTMAEFLSYAVGCMFGRYSLDTPGLILANQGEWLEDYLARVAEPSFMPDDDNVIPILNSDWFPDDITERFRLFLRTTFGEAYFRENLKYIEDSLGKDIRKYFTKDFYADHVKRYKKRPIYWMFSSPKGTFSALIYMHLYRADTVSVLLNDYLREFINKLEAERSRLEKLADDESATQSQRTKALKDAAKIATHLDELRDWERDVIFPLAQQKIEINLDDGVKANYPKFGSALKKIPGVSE